MEYKKSQFNHEVNLPSTNDTICYNFRSHRFARLNEIQKIIFDAAPFDDIPEGFLHDLYECGMLVSGDELESLRADVNTNREKQKVLHVIIYVNMKCNFSCEYCLETGLTSQEEMDQETVEGTVRFIEYVAEHEDIRKIDIVWFGGEPLLSPGIIEKISSELMSFADKRNIVYEAAVYTNGYALTEENVRLLEKCRVKNARISVDGIGEINDRYRHLKDGSGTYERIIDNIRKTKTSMTYRIRCNLNKENQDCYREFVDELRKLERESGNRIACAPERMKVEEHVNRELSEIELSHDEYISVYRDIKECVVRNEDSDIFSLHRSRPVACPACTKYGFDIDVSGKVRKCSWDPYDKEEQVIADVHHFDGSYTNSEKIGFYLNYTFPAKDRCEGCKLLPVCLGRCPLFIKEKDRYGCHRLVNDLDWAVLKLYNELVKDSNNLTKES